VYYLVHHIHFLLKYNKFLVRSEATIALCEKVDYSDDFKVYKH